MVGPKTPKHMMNVNGERFSETLFSISITKHVCFLCTSYHVVIENHVMILVAGAGPANHVCLVLKCRRNEKCLMKCVLSCVYPLAHYNTLIAC